VDKHTIMALAALTFNGPRLTSGNIAALCTAQGC
jgi:hypothetical protein